MNLSVAFIIVVLLLTWLIVVVVVSFIYSVALRKERDVYLKRLPGARWLHPNSPVGWVEFISLRGQQIFRPKWHPLYSNKLSTLWIRGCPKVKGALSRKSYGFLAQTIVKLVVGNQTHAQHYLWTFNERQNLHSQTGNKPWPLISSFWRRAETTWNV